MVKNHSGKKRLFFDIETSMNKGYFFNAGYKQTIPYQNIEKERAIICICYKWEGKSKVHYLSWGKNWNDKKMMRDFIKVLEEADEIVGHNGDRFDLAFIRTRAIYHRLEVTPFLKTIDTLKIARRLFRFNSNRLDYLAKFLGYGGKIKTESGLWFDVMNDVDGSLDKMIRYCKGDVRLLEWVFTELKRYTPAKTHYGRKKSDCPECGSERTIIKCYCKSAAGVVKVDLKCRDCGRMHRVPESAIKNEAKRINGRTIAKTNCGIATKIRRGFERIKIKKSAKEKET